jgi:hypothetical protein
MVTGRMRDDDRVPQIELHLIMLQDFLQNIPFNCKLASDHNSSVV